MDVAGVSSASGDRARVAGAVEAIVFREVLKPLASALGPLGDVVVGVVTDRLFASRPHR